MLCVSYHNKKIFFNLESWRKGNNSLDLRKLNPKLAEGKAEKQISSTEDLKGTGTGSNKYNESGAKDGVRDRRTG